MIQLQLPALTIRSEGVTQAQKYQPGEKKMQSQVWNGHCFLLCAPKPGLAPGKTPVWNQFAASWVPSTASLCTTADGVRLWNKGEGGNGESRKGQRLEKEEFTMS